MPGMQQDVADMQPFVAPHPPGLQPAPEAYVVSTYDARPIMAVDFNTQSGGSAQDTGFTPGGGTDGPGGNAYIAASHFYTVPVGYQAVVRNFQILTVPAFGQSALAGNPVFGPNGESNFRLTYAILVNGTFQTGVSGVVSWAGAFGDIFGDVYVLANSGDTIEFRVLCQDDAESAFFQALISMQGQLLLSKSGQLEFAPASSAVLPVREQTAKGLTE